MVHISRGVRWDSDHVVLLNDESRAILEEVVRSRPHGPGAPRARLLRCEHQPARRVGRGSPQRAEGHPARVARAPGEAGGREEAGDYFGRMQLLEHAKTLPFGAVWDRHCRQAGAPVEAEVLDRVAAYDAAVTRQARLRLPCTRRTSAALLAAALLAGCASAGPAGDGAHTAGSPEEFARLGLSPSRIEAWEDGARTDGGSGHVRVVVLRLLARRRLHARDRLPDQGLSPARSRRSRPSSPSRSTVPTADRIERAVTARAADYTAAKDGCDVRIGACTASGDLRDYVVHYEDDEVAADLRLTATVPSWRPGTGYAFFDERRYLRVAPVRAAGHGRGHRDDRWCGAPGDRRRLPRSQLGQRCRCLRSSTTGTGAERASATTR